MLATQANFLRLPAIRDYTEVSIPRHHKICKIHDYGSMILMSYLCVDNEKLTNSDKKNPFSNHFRKMSIANVEELPTLQAACQADFKNCSERFQMSHEDT